MTRLYLLLIICLLSGCVTIQPTTYQNGKISNPSVGYYGFEIDTPEEYLIADENNESTRAVYRKAMDWADRYSYNGNRNAYVGKPIILYHPEKSQLIAFHTAEMNLPNVSLNNLLEGHFEQLTRADINVMSQRYPDMVFDSYVPENGSYVSQSKLKFKSDTGADVMLTENYLYGLLNEVLVIFTIGEDAKYNESMPETLDYMIKSARFDLK